MDYQRILEDIYREIQPFAREGKPADYIPALARVDADRFGICLDTIDGGQYLLGDASERFSIQSITKVFSLAAALGLEGEALWSRVGREPSGTAFNSPDPARSRARHPAQSVHQCRRYRRGGCSDVALRALRRGLSRFRACHKRQPDDRLQPRSGLVGARNGISQRRHSQPAEISRQSARRHRACAQLLHPAMFGRDELLRSVACVQNPSPTTARRSATARRRLPRRRSSA